MYSRWKRIKFVQRWNYEKSREWFDMKCCWWLVRNHHRVSEHLPQDVVAPEWILFLERFSSLHWVRVIPFLAAYSNWINSLELYWFLQEKKTIHILCHNGRFAVPWSNNRSICMNIFGTAANCRLSFNNWERYSGLSTNDGSVWVAGGELL